MSGTRLIDRYDSVLFDLDGVVYVGDTVVAAAPASMAEVRRTGIGVRFITNNASRTPEEVATRLKGMAITADVAEVVTSATCAASRLAADLPAGSPVLVVGGVSVEEALRDVGLTPVRSADDEPLAILQGWAPTVDWRSLAEGALAVAAGARWVATNMDLTLPGERGSLPGNGSLVAVIAATTRRSPETVGKPEPAMYDAVRGSFTRPLAVGDRLDTDIAGANRAGIDSLLVLTGVSGVRDLLAAPPDHRPRHLARDLGGLLHDPPETLGGMTGGWRCRSATARIVDGAIRLEGDAGPDGLDRLRVGLAAMAAEPTAEPPDASQVHIDS